MPYFDLTRQYQMLQPDIEALVLEILASGRYIFGNRLVDFENAFARYCGVRHAVGVGSGTDALIFSLKALEIGDGDEVIVPSFTFVATVFAIRHAGACPVFADIDPKTYTLDPASVERALTRRTRAILPVHLYGQTADMNGLLSIAQKKKLKVVEDACQAHGAAWKGKKAGAIGDAGCFSFYPTKNLGGFGDGGLVLTRDASLAEKIRRLRNLGRVELQDPPASVGWTSRLDAVQAAVLHLKLNHLDGWNEKRRALANRYRHQLAATPLILPEERKGATHVYNLFVVRVPDGNRDSFRKNLGTEGIPTMLHYAAPVHLLSALKNLGKKLVPLPVTEKISREIVSLPLFPEMRAEEIDRVCEAIRRFYGH